MDPPRYLLNIVRDACQSVDDFSKLLTDRSKVSGTEPRPRSRGLAIPAAACTVVQIAFETASGLITGRDDPGPGRGELGMCLGVGDRGRHQLRELRYPRLGTGVTDPVVRNRRWPHPIRGRRP